MDLVNISSWVIIASVWLLVGNIISKAFVIEFCASSKIPEGHKKRLAHFAKIFSLPREFKIAAGRLLGYAGEFFVALIGVIGATVGFIFEVVMIVVWPLKIAQAYIVIKTKEKEMARPAKNLFGGDGS